MRLFSRGSIDFFVGNPGAFFIRSSMPDARLIEFISKSGGNIYSICNIGLFTPRSDAKGGHLSQNKLKICAAQERAGIVVLLCKVGDL